MIRIYHNSRCSKSRATLALLEEPRLKGRKVEVINYLDTPPSADELQQLLGLLGIGARDLLRKGEEAFKTLGLSDPALSEADLIRAMVEHPILIERPIVVVDGKAVIGRPPENVLAIL